jgi:NAD(P)-dependent dehydrogenase (short-subunit alcohol dehydrogenase family)
MSATRIAVVTGAAGGIGAELAVLLAQNGWDLLLVNRSAARSADTISRVKATRPGTNVDVVEADLADLDSVQSAAHKVLAHGQGIGALFNNAGVLLGGLSMSRHDIDMHAQVNVLAPYLLTKLLVPKMTQSMVVHVGSSAMFRAGRLNLEQLARPTEFKKLFGPYAMSKLALAAMNAAMAREATTPTMRVGEPGPTKTTMTGGNGMPGWLLPIRNLVFAAPSKGAKRIYDTAFEASLGTQSGVYVEKGKIKSLPASAADQATQAQLLTWCRKVTGV